MDLNSTEHPIVKEWLESRKYAAILFFIFCLLSFLGSGFLLFIFFILFTEGLSNTPSRTFMEAVNEDPEALPFFLLGILAFIGSALGLVGSVFTMRKSKSKYIAPSFHFTLGFWICLLIMTIVGVCMVTTLL